MEPKKIVIVGGGTAGWLTAGIIAAEHGTDVVVTLIESPDVATIGVGEGTWPTMRSTLKKIGISETEFIRTCDAAFKQGSRFAAWRTADTNDFYYHPFVIPAAYNEINLLPHWYEAREQVSFADAVCYQSYLCERKLAPKLNTTAEYATIANHGYHLNAGKFAELLHQHCVGKLGVKYVSDHVLQVEAAVDGDIAALVTRNHGAVVADLFIDCSGSQALLLGQHFEVPLIEQKHVLFNDRAWAVQVPYDDPQCAIASATLSTAQTAGWVWDIGLQSRRGVGHVYSSSHIDDAQALRQLEQYVGKADIQARQLKFNPGHRKVFWHKNCVAVGMAAGFIEPLEASALALVELSANMISEQLPQNRAVMDIIARRFNDKFSYRWARIIDFLKLHYVLSERRDSDYWRDNCEHSSIPESLQQLLLLWQHQSPWFYDLTQTDEIFPSASYQYVLCGMGYTGLESAQPGQSVLARQREKAHYHFNENIKQAKQLVARLPDHRALLNKIQQFGLPPI